MSRLGQDARNRALRTFLQGLAADVVAALILLLLPIVSAASGWGDFEWQLLGFLVAKTVVVTLFSYLMRTWLDKSAFPTPLPPSDPGEPDADPDDGPVTGKGVGDGRPGPYAG